MNFKKFKNLDRLQKEFRKEYHYGKLHEKNLKRNPYEQFASWFMEAVHQKVDKSNAMVLSTSSKKGVPSARIVLLKGFDENGFIFYTHYESPKAKDMAENALAVLLFYWPQLERQIRIDGKTFKLSRAESAQYFASRPRDSQLAAWIAHQSLPVHHRKNIETLFHHTERRFKGQAIPLPAFWGGYRVLPNRFEFWQGRENRLNDRFLFKLKSGKKWSITRLYP